MTEPKKIYTIGHSNVPNTFFLELLQKFNINCIADVRSTPYSRYVTQFNQDELKNFLRKNGIRYVFMGKEFGARREDKSLYHPEGYLDFEKTSQCALFKQGMDRIGKGIQDGFNIALMCSEKNAIDCHRSILVGRNFYRVGFEVSNITHDGENESQKQIEGQLVDLYFPKRLEISLFSDDLNSEPQNYEDMILEGYKRRNVDIGYRMDEKEVSYM